MVFVSNIMVPWRRSTLMALFSNKVIIRKTCRLMISVCQMPVTLRFNYSAKNKGPLLMI